MPTKTYTLEIEVEVRMVSRGSPMRGPSFSSPGEPAEAPEFEIETIQITGAKETVEALYKKHKAAVPAAGLKTYDQFFADMLYDNILDQAAEDDWTDYGPDD